MGFQLKSRGKEILSLLKRHGPLSFRCIKELIQPGMQEKKIRLSLSRLCKSGLIVRRQERIFGGAGTFYQLNQFEKVRALVASVLGCNSSELLQPYFKSRELLHSEACAIWTQYLEKCFPTAKVLRDHELYGNQSAHEILLTQTRDFSLMPDIMLILNQHKSHEVRIVFEVERSRKSKSRILEKLKKYADETTLDGVVYLCESSQVSEPVRKIFETKIASKSLRISQYGNYFLVYSDELKIAKVAPKMFSADASPVEFKLWIEHLIKMPLTSRRARNFKVQGVDSSPLSDELKIKL